MSWNFNWHVVTGRITIDKRKLWDEVDRLNHLERSKNNLEWITLTVSVGMYLPEDTI